MFVLDFTKPYMYANTIAFYQGNLSTNNTLRCKLKTGSVEDLTGYACTATFYVNGVEIVETCKIIDRASCIVDVVLPSNALVAGEHKMEVILTKPNVSTIQSPMLKYEVWQGLTTGEGIEGTAEYPVLVELINNTQQAIDKTNELQTEVKASLVLANEEIEKIPGKVQQKVDEITSNIDPLIQDIEKNEEIRQANEAERIKEEDIRKANEKARIDAELVREHNDADHEKAEAVRETNEENRRVAEEGRVEAEKLRVKAESDRVVAEDKRVQAENKRQENYDFMTGDEERRRLEENKRIEAEKVRVASETERISEENKRRAVEASRVKAEETRVSSENTRIANEETRKTQETQRVQAETQRTTKYDKLVQDTNNAVNEFTTYTTQAKAEEETRKQNETTRIESENARIASEKTRESNESVRNKQEDIRVARDENRETVFNGKVRAMDDKIAEGTAKITEVNTAKNTMVSDTRQAIDKMKKDFSALTASQQQDAEVITARDGEESLNARLERDLAKGKIVNETLEGSYITCADTVDGIITDIEIFGNTVQNPEKLDDIKSVGIDNSDGTYNINLTSTTRNICQYVEDGSVNGKGELVVEANMLRTSYIKVLKGQTLYYKWLNDGTLEDAQTWVCVYDINKKFKAKSLSDMVNTICVDEDGYIVLYRTKNTLSGCMVSYTPLSANDYVAYTSDRCSLKLPCQLEKVGDIADRLYFDKVENAWCIEKNIDNRGLNSLSIAKGSTLGTTQNFHIKNLNARNTGQEYDIICKGLSNVRNVVPRVQKYSNGSEGVLALELSKFDTVDKVTKWIEDNNIFILTIKPTPQKIVLPLDTQIQLNQFLGTTNVWLECGEVDGTIKATFSKSIASSTISNTKAIDLLDTRVSNIEGLKETQDIEYTTSTGSLLCKETNTGTIKDIKLSGESMLNLCPKFEINYTASADFDGFDYVAQSYDIGGKRHVLQDIEPNTKYTIMCNVISIGDSGFYRLNNIDDSAVFGDLLECKTTGFHIFHVTSKSELTSAQSKALRCQNKNCRGNVHIKDIMILKGHVQNPPSYFEGIGSVGNGIDTIEVVSSSKNIFTTAIELGDILWGNGATADSQSGDKSRTVDFIKVLPRVNYAINKNCVANVYFYDKDKQFISPLALSQSNQLFNTPSNCQYIKFRFLSGDLEYKYQLEVDRPTEYVNPKQDKKPILFKDTDGNWKPVSELRGLDTVCDTVELHNDSKYYYHRRTTTKTFIGAEDEDWRRLASLDTENTERYAIYISDVYVNGKLMSNRFKYIYQGGADKSTCIYIHNEDKRIDIKKLKTDTRWTDLVSFKKWLKANPLTIVYQCSELVFEVNPLFLDSYEGETLIQIISGVMSPEVELKITSYISGLVITNARRIKELENEIYKEQEAQNEIILENDMRIIDLEIALMDAMPTLNIRLGGEDVQERSKLYFDFLKGRIESGNYTDEYLERVINKYLQGKRITQEEYDVLYDMIYPPVYDLPQE